VRCDWATATTAAATVVLLASVLRTNPLVLALLVGLAAIHGTLAVRAVRRCGDADDAGEPVAGAAAAGTRLGLVVVASLQLMGVSVTLWFACALLVVATSPAVRPVLAAFFSLGAAADRPTTGDLLDLSDDVLLDLWRTSARMLLDPLPPTTRCRLVARRAQYLDELERRHPDRVQAWLATELRGESF
jgi:hypothetical protein